MLEILRDPVWQFIGALLALLAIAVSFWVYILQKPKKRLLIERVARVPLITLGADATPGLQITMNGRTINQATVILVRVVNIGNTPLPASDFESPITLEFEEKSIVLDARIAETEPKDIPVQVTNTANTLSITKTLLNPGDSFTCRALVQDSKGSYAAKARVSGVQRIEESRPIAIGKSITLVVALIVLVITMILTPKPISISPLDLRTEEIPYLAVFSVTFLILMLVAFSDLGNRLRSVRTRLSILGVSDA